MIEIGTYEEIMRASSTYVDDYTMSLQFPACPSAGYFLFSSVEGDGPVQALNLGLNIGFCPNVDFGSAFNQEDAYATFVITHCICDGVSYRVFDGNSYNRSHLVYSRAGLDMQLSDAVRIRGKYPYFEMYFYNKVHDIRYQIEGKAGYVHWLPDHIMFNQYYSYVCFPDFDFHGTVTVKGKPHPVHGVGGFDHLNAQMFKSPTVPRIGYWHYDPVHWDSGYASNGLYFLGSRGEPYVHHGMTTLFDGAYHPSDDFKVEYLELAMGSANAGTAGEAQVVPRRWRATLKTQEGVLTYETRPMAVKDPAGKPVIEPNVCFFAEGEYVLNSGKVLPCKGKGHNEYMRALLDPHAL